MDTPAQNKTPAPQSAPAPYELRGMGEILVVLTACGYRLDRIMGEAEHMKITRRAIKAGLLDEKGDPTSKGDAAASAFLAKRDASVRSVRLAAVTAAVKEALLDGKITIPEAAPEIP